MTAYINKMNRLLKEKGLPPALSTRKRTGTLEDAIKKKVDRKK